MGEIQRNDYFDKIQGYISTADLLMKDIVEFLAPLYKSEYNDKMQDVTVPLFTTLHSTGESILLLLYYESSLSDADILLRTVMEGTMKYCYLLSGNEAQRSIRYEEYKIHLTDIGRLADHYKAKNSIAALKKFSNNSVKTLELSILDAEELSELKMRYSKKFKNQLKSKWSYQAILKELAKDNVFFESQLATLSAYSLSSHLTHYDCSGLTMRQAHIMNSESENNLEISFSHAIRVLSNVLSFYVFRVIYYIQRYDIVSEELGEMIIATLDYIKELDEVGTEIIDKHL